VDQQDVTRTRIEVIGFLIAVLGFETFFYAIHLVSQPEAFSEQLRRICNHDIALILCSGNSPAVRRQPNCIIHSARLRGDSGIGGRHQNDPIANDRPEPTEGSRRRPIPKAATTAAG